MIIILAEVSLYLLLCHSVDLTQSKSLQFRATSPPVEIHIHTCEDLFHHSLPDLQSIHSILYPALENRGQNVLICVTCKIFSPFTENQEDSRNPDICLLLTTSPEFDLWKKHIFCLFGSFSVVLYRLSAKMHPIYQVNTDLVQSALHLVELQRAVATHSGGFLPQGWHIPTWPTSCTGERL